MMHGCERNEYWIRNENLGWKGTHITPQTSYSPALDTVKLYHYHVQQQHKEDLRDS